VNTAEPSQAQHWRLEVVKLSLAELAEKTGYSVRAIYLFESGVANSGKPHAAKVWLRYRRACAGVDVELRGQYDFRWGVRSKETADAK
jgi:hypothetical protein